MGWRLSPELEAKCLALAGVGSFQAPPPDDETEKGFQADVIKLAKRLGWPLVYHTHDSRKSAAGFPDLVIARPGLVLAPELKVGDNQPSAAQAEWLQVLDGAVIRAQVWRPEMWGEIERALRGN